MGRRRKMEAAGGSHHFVDLFRSVRPRCLVFVALLLLQLSVLPPAAGEGISASLPDGTRFQAGQTVTLACQASGVANGLSVRLFCPLARHSGSAASAACFEDCRRPLCADAASAAMCRLNAPELLEARCAMDRRASSDGSDTYDVSIVYHFDAASARHSGNYTCQYKQMRSNAQISVLSPPPVVTTSSTSTTAVVTTTVQTTGASSSTTAASTTQSSSTTGSTTSSSTASTTTSSTSTASSTSSTLTSSTVRTSKKPTAIVVPVLLSSSSGTTANSVRPTQSTLPDRKGLTEEAAAISTTQAADWFHSEVISSLQNGHVLVAGLALLVVLIVILAVSLTCCLRRGCSGSSSSSHKSPHLSNGGRRTPHGGASLASASLEDEVEMQQLMQHHQQSVYRQLPPPLPTTSRPNSQSFQSQIYNEADPTPQASNGSTSYYVHPKPAGAAAAAAATMSTSATDAPGGGGFFRRSQDGRHSFHSVHQASRQRVGEAAAGVGASDSAELLSGGRGGNCGGATVGINVGGPVDVYGYGAGRAEYHQDVVQLLREQGKELQRLNQQVRASQQALSRLAASYQDLHRSVSLSRVRHPSSPRHSPLASAAAATTPDSSTEDPYDTEVAQLLPSPADVAAATAAMTAAAAAVADEVDDTDGLASSRPAAPDRVNVVDTINEELEGEDTLRPMKKQQQQQQQQRQ